jgi:hypothetical protein
MANPFTENIRGVSDLIDNKTNKVGNNPISSTEEGIVGEKKDEFELDMKDYELISLAKKWEMAYATYEAKIVTRQKAQMMYYLGTQKANTGEESNISANFIFEAVETFIPASLSRNPEPVVWSDNTPQGNKIADDVKTMLQYHADTLVLRRKLQLVVRNWGVDFLGVLKHGWDAKVSDIKTEVRDVKNFIFEPTGYVDMYGDFVGYLGERITVTADKLVSMFPKHEEFITVTVDGKMGTQVAYTEWWTDEYCFYTYKNKVLDKNKNPHFNYDREAEATPFQQPNPGEGPEIVKGRNHFAIPKKPFTFLSVFSFGKQPHDVTGLVEQNIPNQRLISRRVEQIDYNISRSNHSRAYSGNNFTQETAKQASVAAQKGHDILVPAGGPINQAIADFPVTPLPASTFTDLSNNIENLRSIFGTAGITSANQQKDETARGMILKQQYDNSRIGGGIGDAIQQVADNVFNWWTQLYYVYYDEPHFASVMGQLRATEYIELSSQNLSANLIVSVAPDSMKPHDEITEMNQALSLWESQAIDPQTLLTRLNFPNPKETAGQLWLYKTNPQMYGQLNFPDIVQQIQQQMARMAPPGAPQEAGGGQPQPGQPIQGEQVPTTGGVPASSSLSQVPLNS